MDKDNIPVSMPDLSGNEESYVVQAIRSTWISSSGKFVQCFEREFARMCDSRYAIAVSNGTVALHLAMLSLGVGPGDEVLVPSLTYVATANAVKYVGAEPVFVDVDPDTWCIDPRQMEEHITHRTKGIIAVHLYGHPADMDPINQIATDHGLWVVEDAAEAHFARYKGQVVGSLGKLATFSFYGNKIITSGEGGAIVLNDPELEYYIRMLRGQGMDPGRRYYFPIVGYNYRMTNVASAILCAQLERAEQIVERRRYIYKLYNTYLSGIPGIGLQPVAQWAEITPWLYSITVDPDAYGHTRDELIDLLAREGVETRPFFFPLHRLPPFRELARKQGAELPVTERLAARGLNLPTYPGLRDEQIEWIAELIHGYARV